MLHVAPTLQDAYLWLRAQQSSGAKSSDEHLDLAEWCIRHELWPEASRELLEARALAPDSERAGLVERRLMMLSQQPERTVVAQATSAEPAERAVKESEVTSELAPLPRLPESGMEQFARRIQPLLVNNCTTGGCHASNASSSFPLDRSILYGYANARSTEANLRSTLLAIDTKEPGESPLLTAARGPHHGVTPLQGHHRAEWIARLELWTEQVARSNGWQPLEELPEETPAEGLAPKEGELILTGHEVEQPATPVDPLDKPLAPAPVVRGGLIQAIEPRDEFDPEIFNRKYRRAEDDLPDEPAAAN